MSDIEKYSEKTFDDIKHVDQDGQEFWYARELQGVLAYTEWRNFSNAIEKAMTACAASGNAVEDHFVDVNKMVSAGVAEKPVDDFMLSRYACYLIVMNGDPRKEVIAVGQTYFAIKTRQQELIENYDALNEEQKRVAIRGEMKRHNAALAANLFRATQTEEKLRRDHIQGKAAANKTHYTVGRKVRQTIQELGGTMPEDLPTPEKSIKEIEKTQNKKLPEGSNDK